MDVTERIWAPVRPTLEPDAVALALLSPHGGDAAGDLGASLLGMHRAGAAACEVVAKGALPSEKRLVEALATCRTKLGVAATDAVSKSMEERYAGLLVRDLLDDADLAALAVYRTCVAKGVAPPLAASRAGAVYGVPLRELGRYQTLAADPRVNPVALIDAADRTLLGFVSKVVALEAGQVKEVVSKAPVGHARELGASDEGWDEREHPRSPTTGQFVHAPPRGGPPVREAEAQAPRAPQTAADRLRARLGLLDVAPEVVGTPEPPVQAPPVTRAPTTPQQRQGRQGRQGRQVRQTRQAAQPAAAVAGPKYGPQQNLSAGPLQGSKLTSQALHQATLVTRRLREAMGISSKDEVKSRELTVPRHSQSSPPHDLMQLPMPLGSGDEYADMYAPLVFNVGSEEATELRVRAAGYGTSDNPRRLRAGWLIEGAGRPELFEDHEVSTSRRKNEAERAADHVAAIARARAIDQDLEKPVVATIHPEQRLRLDAIASLTRAEMAAAPEWVNEDDRDAVQEEMSYIEPMTDIYTGDQVLVHWQPARDANGEVTDTYRRKKPMVVQFIMQGQSFRGREEGVGDHIEYLVDPNQALAISADYDDYWDSVRNVVIRRYQLRPLSEAEVTLYDKDDDAPGKLFGKALRGYEAVEFEQLHPRDTGGRFAPKASARSAIAPTALPTRTQEPAVTTPAPAKPRQQRQARQQRQGRQGRQVRQIRQAAAVPTTAAPRLGGPRLSSGRTVQPVGLVQQQMAAPQLFSERLVSNIRDVFNERLEYVPDLPALNLDSDFRVFTRGEWLDIEDALDDDTIDALFEPGAWIPFRGLAALRVLEAKKRNFDRAQIQLVNNAADDLFSNEHDIVRRPLGDPIALGESVDEEIALGHHIADAFDEWPEIDQIEVIRDPESHYVQLYGNKRPVATQTLLEIEPGIDLSRRDLMLQNVGQYRTKQVNVTDGRDVLPMLSADQDYEGVGALNLPVRILRVTAPKVHYRRVIEDE